MGITISSKNYSCDLGFGGFKRFREVVARLSSESFGVHYKTLNDANFLYEENKRKLFFEEFDKRTKELIDNGEIAVEIANFCLQSDCAGAITPKQSKMIFEKIRDYDDEFVYGYAGRSHVVTFQTLKEIFEDGSKTRKYIRWN